MQGFGNQDRSDRRAEDSSSLFLRFPWLGLRLVPLFLMPWSVQLAPGVQSEWERDNDRHPAQVSPPSG